MTSSRRPGSSGSGVSRRRTISFQSCTAHLHDAVHRAREFAPVGALGCEGLAAGGRETVKTAAAPAGRLPFALQPAAALEPVEERVKRSNMETDNALRTFRNEFSNFVAVAGLFLKQRQDQQFRVAFFKFTVQCSSHIWL